ncbi:hypothetical protein HMPREF1612_04856 [Escherichia coli 908585]|nr:hypothetical protein HMPREF1600_02599 [Escherichia coli 907715]ESD51479.1 hypothetical protein HMPREF1605_03233 [Escherichia coli 908521]ESD82005.1 hypothetical protein HMPREF1612_04856 [Escherichia coli 908585]KXH01383.1 hypothetical protein HMPREF3040_01166 [Escherichia coli]
MHGALRQKTKTGSFRSRFETDAKRKIACCATYQANILFNSLNLIGFVGRIRR